MDPFDAVDPATALSGAADWISPALASALAHHPLDAVETEYPHYVRAVEGPDETFRPREQHPVFYGCYDWHSAVHSHWSLVRQLRLFPDHPDAAAMRASIGDRLTDDGVAGEVAHFAEHPGFEKPYGWGWLLRLAAELHLWEDPLADEWRATLRPLEDRIRELTREEFLGQERPFRGGMHTNSAFGLTCVLDYARVVGDDELAAAAAATARRFYADDRDYPFAYEPLGWDFLSPGLVEADLMRRVLDPAALSEWLDGFLPDLTAPPHDAVLTPVEPDVETGGGGELHLVGLNLSRAWCLAGVAAELDDGPTAERLAASARDHAERGLADAFVDDYAGTHWLSSFALYLVTRAEGGIAPAAGD